MIGGWLPYGPYARDKSDPFGWTPPRDKKTVTEKAVKARVKNTGGRRKGLTASYTGVKKPKAKLKPESDVKTLVADWFKSLSAWHYAPIQNGLGVHGIHDRVGCVPVTVTPAMVGKRIGLFASVEAKAEGRRNEQNRGMTTHQYNNMVDILIAGGLSIVCDGQEDLDGLSRRLIELVGE